MDKNLTSDLNKSAEDWIKGSPFTSHKHKDHTHLISKLKELDVSEVLVLGEDLNKGITQELEQSGFKVSSMRVSEAVSTKFFKAECIVCLEVLNHLPLWMGVEIINNLVDSEHKYLVINTCPGLLDNIGTGPDMLDFNSAQ